MARTPIIAGNWKMNTLRSEAIALATGIRQRTDAIGGVEKIVCPPFVHLRDVSAVIHSSSIWLGAQDAHWEEKGAFTGEVSITQVAEVASHVIIGHSERRQLFGETDETVNKKLLAALAHGLTPIMCVGETLDQRQNNETDSVLVRQIVDGLANVAVGPDFIIAYEPVWAIGTGLAADGATAQRAIALIRDTVRTLATHAADEVRILYGGSVTPENIGEYMAQPDIDGGLVGGASLKVESFARIVEATKAAVSTGSGR